MTTWTDEIAGALEAKEELSARQGRMSDEPVAPVGLRLLEVDEASGGSALVDSDAAKVANEAIQARVALGRSMESRARVLNRCECRRGMGVAGTSPERASPGEGEG